MANWKHKINLVGIWKNDDLSVEDKGKAIAKLLRKKLPDQLDYNHNKYDSDLEDIVERFENITGYDNVTPTEEFDDVMDLLYDWGDLEVEPYGQWPPHKNCWIQTF